MSELGDAERAARRRFGQVLAGKASPQLCQRLLEAGSPARTRRMRPTRLARLPISLGLPGAVASAETDLGTSGIVGSVLTAVGRRLPIHRRGVGLLTVVAQTDVGDRLAGWPELPPATAGPASLEARREARRAVARGRAAAFGAAAASVTRGFVGPGEPDRELLERLVVPLWINRTVHATALTARVVEAADMDEIVRLDVPGLVVFHAGGVGGAGVGGAGRPANVAGTFGLPLPLAEIGEGVVVGVVDGEVDAHPSLGTRAGEGANLTTEPWGVPDDHATMLAGLIAADGAAYRGVAPGARIRNYKIRATNPAFNVGETAASQGVQRAAEDGADVVVCAWCLLGAEPIQRSRDAFVGAAGVGAVVVKSAGNDGPEGGTLSEPVGEGALVVGACDRAGTRVADYSSRGPVGAAGAGPDLVAPGGEPADLLPGLQPGLDALGGGWGTSYAAALVAGLAACVIDHRGDTQEGGITESATVRSAVVDLCRPIPQAGPLEQGSGAVLTP